MLPKVNRKTLVQIIHLLVCFSKSHAYYINCLILKQHRFVSTINFFLRGIGILVILQFCLFNFKFAMTFYIVFYNSIGNFFFAGARIFFQSLDAAIFLFSRVSQIPAESLVLPVISTNDRLTLGCELWVCRLFVRLFIIFYFSGEGFLEKDYLSIISWIYPVWSEI